MKRHPLLFMHCCRGNRVSVPKVYFKDFYFTWEHMYKNKTLNKSSNSIVVSTCSCCHGNKVKSHFIALSIVLAKNKMLHCCFCALRYLSAKWPLAGVENVNCACNLTVCYEVTDKVTSV